MLAKTEKNRGAIMIMFVLLITVMMFMLAFAVDVGYVYTTQAELQHAADAAALAAMWDLVDQTDPQAAIDTAVEYGAYNRAADKGSLLVEEADVEIGFMNDPFNYDPDDIRKNFTSHNDDPSLDMNTVIVTVKRSESNPNGPLGLLLGSVTGMTEMNLQAEARAFITNQIIGFDQAPGVEIPDEDGGSSSDEGGGDSSGENALKTNQPKLWPFTMSNDFWTEYWEAQNDYLLHGCDPSYSYTISYLDLSGDPVEVVLRDQYSLEPYDDGGEDVEYNRINECDGILEFDLYPFNTGSSGNFGMIDIGLTNNSARDANDQIAYGVTDEDIEHAGGQFLIDDGLTWVDLNNDGEPQSNEYYGYELLSADTGVSWSVKNAILGQGSYNERLIGDPFIVTVFNDAYNRHDLDEESSNSNSNNNKNKDKDKDKKPVGENTVYQVIGFATLKVLEVKQGGDKGIICQPVGYKELEGVGGGGGSSSGAGDSYSSGSGYDVSGSAIIGFDGPVLPNSSLFVYGLTR